MEQGRVGLLGEKLSHSFSKIIHEKLCNYKYDLIEVSKENFNSFMLKKEFRALNVTIPYKEAVIPFLDFIDDKAREIGAVNTIINKNGKLYGYNTDFDGLKYMLSSSGISVTGKTVLLLGSGGTCKTAVAVLKNENAKEILVASRDTTKENTISYEQAQSNENVEIVINTSPVGMYPNLEDVPIGLKRFSKLCGVADVIYNPLKTRLLLNAEELSVKTSSGLSMLVRQAYLSAEYFLGEEIDEKKADGVLRWLEKTQRNIVLIGMPTSGKSRLAYELAKNLKLELIDIDSEIVKREKKTIEEIFSEKGENYFREVETKTVKWATAKKSKNLKGRVIATGGGVVKNLENIIALKQNGIIIFVDRPLKDLMTGKGRPLSPNVEAVEKLYNERIHLYKGYCDIEVKNETTFEDLVRNTLKKIKEI